LYQSKSEDLENGDIDQSSDGVDFMSDLESCVEVGLCCDSGINGAGLNFDGDKEIPKIELDRSKADFTIEIACSTGGSLSPAATMLMISSDQVTRKCGRQKDCIEILMELHSVELL
jgi:hypothetical protein